MWDKAFRGSLTLVPAGYIGPADTTLTSDFPLGAGRFVIQTVAHGDDHPLPGRQAGMDTLPDLDAGISSIQVLQHVVVHRNHIHKRQRPSIPRRLQSLCEGYLPLKLPLGPEMHQNLICYPHTMARQDRPGHRQAVAGGRYRPHGGYRRQRGKYVPSPRPKRRS